MTPHEYETVCRLFKDINLNLNTMCLKHNLIPNHEHGAITRDLFSLGVLLGDIHDRSKNPLPDVDRTKCYLCGARIVFDYNSDSFPFVAEVGTFCDTKCMRAYEKQGLTGNEKPLADHSNCDHCGALMEWSNSCIIDGDKTFCRVACLDAAAASEKCECGADAGTLHVCYTQMYKDPKFREMVESLVDARIKEVNGPS